MLFFSGRFVNTVSHWLVFFSEVITKRCRDVDSYRVQRANRKKAVYDERKLNALQDVFLRSIMN